MRYPSPTTCLLLLATTITAPSLRAQWVSFQDQTTARLAASNALVAGDTQEKDYDWADLDKDGDVADASDLRVCVDVSQRRAG